MSKWEKVKLGALANYINGYAFKPKDWVKDGLPIIRIEQLKNPLTSYDYYSGKVPQNNLIFKGDLIFSWSASFVAKIWNMNDAVLNQHLYKVIPKEDNNIFFLKHLLDYHIIKFENDAHGSTMKHLKRNELLDYLVNIPLDKSIQTRIAEILSTADKAIEDSEKLIAKYKRMKTGMMQDLLTKGIDENGNIRSEATHKFKDSPLGRIPVEWEVKRLEEVCIYVSDGSHFSPKAREEGFVIGNVKDMEEFDFNYNSCTKISIRDYEVLVSQNCQPLKGDILLSKDGTIGKVFVFNKDKKIVILSSIAILRPSDKYSSLYLSYLLKSQYFNKNLIKFISGSALKRIVIRDIKKMIFPLSSDEREQNRICDYLSEIDSLVFVETETLSKLKRLKAGLMNDLLSGKVEVVDN
ncbi:MAG TPA: restriction endonuclease subunit S [Candidatus Kapabacteria bacterium]|nr:restriction endonuclease subunit S [Candidatus Kapabacteria bacterium]